MKSRIVYSILSVAVLVIAIGFSGRLINAKPQPKKDGQMHNITYVKAEQINYEEVDSEMFYRGRVTAYDNVSLGAEVSGKILQGDVRFKAGEQFRQGQVLLRIYSEDVEASLKSSKSAYLQTISNVLPDLKIDYNEEYDKWLSFFNAINVESSLPELPTIDSNKEKVFLASNNVLTSYYNIEQQEINLSRYTIRAPFDGSFKTVNKEIGAVSSPGTELASLIRTDKLEITVPVFPSDLTYINKGDRVEIVNNKGEVQMASVSRISNFVESSTQSVNVYLTYKASSVNGFLEGEYVDVHFAGEQVVGFELPREALVDGNKVYVLDNKKLELQEVQVLRQLDDSYIISMANREAVVVTESIASVDANMEYQARS